MKKLVVLTACLLSCFLVCAQEADNTGRSVGLSVIPRLDLNPQFPVDGDGESDFTLGNSSLNTLFEGNISKNLSFSVANHWLSQDTKALYSELGKSWTTNWLNWAYLDWSFGQFSLRAGKDMILTGGLEYDDYDFEVDYDFTSGLWNNLSCYQWGGKFGWSPDKGGNTFSAQVSTSPFGEKPFKSGLYNYSFQWYGENGPLTTIWSVTALGEGQHHYMPLIALGQRIEAGFLTFGLDWFNKAFVLQKGNTFLGTVTWSPSQKLDLIGKVNYERESETDLDMFVIGTAAHWYPLKDNRNLKIHSSLAYNSLGEYISLTAGIMYWFNI